MKTGISGLTSSLSLIAVTVTATGALAAGELRVLPARLDLSNGRDAQRVIVLRQDADGYW